MPRYFLEVSYKGAGYSGFQAQKNANSIQAEIEKAFEVFLRRKVEMTGSSRTDTGVHALCNFFHFDFEGEILHQSLYNINAILPGDIVVKGIYVVKPGAHCRFDATAREYSYYVFQHKNPFLQDRAYYYPYTLDMEKLDAAAAIITSYTDFTSFSKRNTQVKTFQCSILNSGWRREEECFVYNVRANRFLRGMVRGLVGTMLQVGRGKISVSRFEEIIRGLDSSYVDFSVPGHGLFLMRVHYPDDIFVTDAPTFIT
jgi:tRNA pseudouridine38-40 synthase